MVRAQGAGRWWSGRPPAWALPAVFRSLLLAAFVVSCGNDSRPPFAGTAEPHAMDEGCASVAEGCPCEREGDTIACGQVASSDGDKVECVEGQRRCSNAAWGACSADRRVMKYAPRAGSRLLGLADAGVSCNNPCDPTCREFRDTPTDLDAGPGFIVENGGLTLPGTNSDSNCSNIVIEPALATIKVTRLMPLTTTPSDVTFQARCGVGGPVITPAWTILAVDALYASIDPTGVFSVEAPVARTVEVTASSAGSEAKASVEILVDATTIDGGCSAADFDEAPVGDDVGTTLYPYAVAARPVVFPLGLAAPTVQWATGGVDAHCVRVSLRYPVGSDTPKFFWSRIATSASGQDPREGAVDPSQPALAVEQAAWSAFDRSAQGQRAEILVQRQRASSGLLNPMAIPVEFASDGLRGTVYYTQYQRRLRNTTCSASGQVDIDINAAARQTSATTGCQGAGCASVGPVCPVGNCTQLTAEEPGRGGVRALDLSVLSAAPTDPFGGTTSGCTVCHSVSADGRTFVAGTFASAKVPTIASIDREAGTPVFDARADAPAYSLKTNRGESSGPPEREQSSGFSAVAISPDGRFVLQGPNFWGNTSSTQTYGQGNSQDAGYTAGGKRFFLFQTQKFRRNVYLATESPLAPHSRTPTQLRNSSVTDPLTIDGYEVSRGDTVLVKDEPIASDNGLYEVTDEGYNWELTRLGEANDPGELAFGDKVLVEEGFTNAGKYFHLASPTTGTITPGTTALSFALYATVMAASTGALPPYTVNDGNWNGRQLIGNEPLPADVFDGVPLALKMSVLIKDESNPEMNGIYRLDENEPAFRLSRRADANDFYELSQFVRVRVNQGTTNGGRTFVLTTPEPLVDASALFFAPDALLDEGSKLNDGGAPTTLPTMMYPVFSPNGRSLAYVNGDRDALGGAETGWRRGISLLDFDGANALTPFSNKRRLLDSYSAASAGRVLKSPQFESDSRGLLFVETPPDEFCPSEAYTGTCATPDCSASDSSVVNVDSDLERACFQTPTAAGYGNAAPIVRGHWPGKLRSVNVTTAAESTLGWLSSGLAAQDAIFASDGGNAYQPTMLPTSSGGYRWVVFSSTRAYGNQLNATGTHFSCAAPLLWMAAVDDTEAATVDRSHPAFLLPGQRLRSITDPSTSRHYLNERAVLVPSPRKDENEQCTTNEECKGATEMPPTARCSLEPGADPPVRRCRPTTSCLAAGEACGAGDVCCAGAPCRSGICLPRATHLGSVYRRTFKAECPHGYVPRWGDFSWRADAQSSSRINFSVKAADSETFAMVTGVEVATADRNNVNAPPAAPRRVNIGQLLLYNALPTGTYLELTMDFIPSGDATVAPILFDWNQVYDCIAAE